MIESCLVDKNGHAINEPSDCAFLQVTKKEGNVSTVAIITPTALYEYLISINLT